METNMSSGKRYSVATGNGRRFVVEETGASKSIYRVVGHGPDSISEEETLRDFLDTMDTDDNYYIVQA